MFSTPSAKGLHTITAWYHEIPAQSIVALNASFIRVIIWARAFWHCFLRWHLRKAVESTVACLALYRIITPRPISLQDASCARPDPKLRIYDIPCLLDEVSGLPRSHTSPRIRNWSKKGTTGSQSLNARSFTSDSYHCPGTPAARLYNAPGVFRTNGTYFCTSQVSNV